MPSKADFRICNFSASTTDIAFGCCEQQDGWTSRGARSNGRHAADRADTFWGEPEISSLLAVAARELNLALVLVLFWLTP
jgi:hypothetical protein